MDARERTLTTDALARPVVVYDRDCRFCRWSLEKLLGWDRHARVRPLALQDPQAERLLASLDTRVRMASWHLVTVDGEVHSAGRAVEPLLRLLPGGRPLSWLAAKFPALTNAAYALVARNRSLLGRIVRSRGGAA